MSKKIQYDQNIVNDNLIETFDMVAMDDNQILQKEPKKKGRGGARINSGRKTGSTVKLSAADLLKEISRIDKPFAEGLAEDYKRARDEGDLHIVQRYQQMFLSKVIADKQEVDVTSNGQTLGASFSFPTTELIEWTDNTIDATIKTH